MQIKVNSEHLNVAAGETLMDTYFVTSSRWRIFATDKGPAESVKSDLLMARRNRMKENIKNSAPVKLPPVSGWHAWFSLSRI